MKRRADSSPAETESKRPAPSAALPPAHSGAFDAFERTFHAYYGSKEALADHVMAAAESIRANFSDRTRDEDAASLWMAIKLINIPQLRPRAKHMAAATGTTIKHLVAAELRLCRKAEWNFAFIMMDHM